MHDDPQPRLSTFALANGVLRGQRWIAAATLVGGLIGLGLALATVHRYEASVRFVTTTRTPRGIEGVGTDLSPIQERDPFDFYASLLTSTSMLDRVLATATPGGATVADRLAAVDATPAASQADRRRQLLRTQPRLDATSRTRSLPVLALRASSTSPDVAADVANAFIDGLLAYDTELRSSSAKNRAAFIEGRLAETEASLRAAEDALRKFRDENRVLIGAQAATTSAGTDDSTVSARVVAPPLFELRLDQLERDLTVQSELYLTLKKALDQARISAFDESPGLVIIDRAMPPLAPATGSRRRLVFLGLMLGFAGGVAIALALDVRRRITLTSPDAVEFVAHLQGWRHAGRRLSAAVRTYLVPPAGEAERPQPSRDGNASGTDSKAGPHHG